MLALSCASCSYLMTGRTSQPAKLEAEIDCPPQLDFAPDADKVGEYVTGAAAVIATLGFLSASGGGHGGGNSSDLIFFGAVDASLVAAATAFGYSASRGYRNQDLCERKQAARELTLQARTAALAGQCTKTIELGVQVRKLDPELHQTLFMTEPAIAHCWELSPVPPASVLIDAGTASDSPVD